MSEQPNQSKSGDSLQLTLRDASGQLVGTVGTTAEGIYSFNEVLNNDALNAQGPEMPSASLAGSVYLDINRDGVRGPGEPGYPGVTVALQGTLVNGRTVHLQAVTDNDGRYRFEDLEPGFYRLELQTQIPNTQPGKLHLGTLGGQESGGALLCSVQAGQSGERYDFARILPLLTRPAAKPAAPTFPTAGPTTSASAAVLSSPSVSVEPPTPIPISARDFFFSVLGHETLGAALFNSSALGPTAVEVPANEALSTLSGLVFHDRDADGELGENDQGIAGVAVTISGSTTRGKPVQVTKVTDEDGMFTFTEIPPGTYSLTRQLPSGYLAGRPLPGTINGSPCGKAHEEAIRGIVLAAGAFGLNFRFAEVRAASLTGIVQLEDTLDDDGPLEMPLSGLLVILAGTDYLRRPVQLSTTTDARGQYRFTGLYPGTYEIYPAPPRGLAVALARVGDKGGRVAGGGKLTAVVLASGETGTRYNFILQGTGSLVGKVVSHARAGRIPLAGVTITLTGRDQWGNDLLRTVATDAQGIYRFAQLRTGYYRVEAATPGGYHLWDATPGNAGGEAEGRRQRPPAIDAIALTSGAQLTGYDFFSGSPERQVDWPEAPEADS
ncbi:MAG: SdrD B-like domain-containing protein [Gemmataceae bacterium]